MKKVGIQNSCLDIAVPHYVAMIALFYFDSLKLVHLVTFKNFKFPIVN